MSKAQSKVHAGISHQQTVLEGKDASIAPFSGLLMGHQFSVEEKKLISLHPAIANVITEPASI